MSVRSSRVTQYQGSQPSSAGSASMRRAKASRLSASSSCGQLAGTRAERSRASASRSDTAARAPGAVAAISSSRGVASFSTGGVPASALATGVDEGPDPFLVRRGHVHEVQPAAEREAQHLPVALGISPRHLHLHLHRLLVVGQVEADAEHLPDVGDGGEGHVDAFDADVAETALASAFGAHQAAGRLVGYPDETGERLAHHRGDCRMVGRVPRPRRPMTTLPTRPQSLAASLRAGLALPALHALQGVAAARPASPSPGSPLPARFRDLRHHFIFEYYPCYSGPPAYAHWDFWDRPPLPPT